VLNTASRTRSVVGRVLVPAGASIFRPPKYPATTRTPTGYVFESAILAVMSSAEEPYEPYPQIDCIDCGGRAFLLTHPREEGPRWLPGDIVAYRCEDCLDRWDLVLPEDDEFPEF